MKADVFPQGNSLGLDIPSWVPEPIAQRARAKHAADVDWAYRVALEESGDVSGPGEYLAEVARQDGVREAFADWVRDDLADITERYLPLVCDRRMESVWRELSRQRNGAFLHPARALVREVGVNDFRMTPEYSSAANTNERQEMALVELFETALLCQETRWGVTMTARQVEGQRGRYLAKAQELQSDAIAIMAAPWRA
jgi:hypothetical protein